MDDTARLLEIYRQKPCRTLPNAFWKSCVGASQSRLIVKGSSLDDLQFLSLWDGSKLMSLWCDDPSRLNLTPRQIDEISFALVHDNCLSNFEPYRFSTKKAYFRLHFMGSPPQVDCPDGFNLITVDPSKDIPDITLIINACYPDIMISDEIVRRWIKHPVYDPRLWVWIKDQITDKYAALGIAEFDPQVPEASLEWIQVHPDYQKRGLGKTIVSELINRIHHEVEFITVSGEIDNPFKPAKLYRQCGFEGTDIWWLLKA